MGLRSKKGNLGFDIIIFLGVLFVFGMIIQFTHIIQSDMNDSVQEDEDIPTVVKDLSQTSLESNVNMWDNAFVFVFVMLWIAIIISSFYVDSHPIFLIISILLMIFVIIYGAYMANTYDDFASDEDVIDFSASFPSMNYIFNHLVEFIIAIFITTALALFGKNQFGWS